MTNETTPFITNAFLKNCVKFDSVDFNPLFEYFSDILNEPSGYSLPEINFAEHFVQLYNRQDYYQMTVDYFYILQKYEALLENDFLHDFYIINNIDFYDNLSDCILSYRSFKFENDTWCPFPEVDADHLISVMKLDENPVCDELFNKLYH